MVENPMLSNHLKLHRIRSTGEITESALELLLT